MQVPEYDQTWVLTPLPRSKTKTRCKWVFSIKTVFKNGQKRFKARLEARSCSQCEGIDYEGTFAPVRHFAMSKFDVKTAFLYGDIDKEIYLEQPEDQIDKKKPTYALKLLCSLYGLKQAPRCWNKKFVEFLKKLNFKSFGGEKRVFVGEISGTQWIYNSNICR